MGISVAGFEGGAQHVVEMTADRLQPFDHVVEEIDGVLDISLDVEPFVGIQVDRINLLLKVGAESTLFLGNGLSVEL
ncbi:MAG: hypothetical protein V3V55_08620 [Rhodospirillales bacterium]